MVILNWEDGESGSCPARGHLMKSGNIFGGHNFGREQIPLVFSGQSPGMMLKSLQ